MGVAEKKADERFFSFQISKIYIVNEILGASTESSFFLFVKESIDFSVCGIRGSSVSVTVRLVEDLVVEGKRS